MKKSRRARRMERFHKGAKTPALNLVSLMDIFTILVFFLLVNSSNTQQLPNNKDLKLPSSISRTAPEESLIIAITKDQVLVKGRHVATLDNIAQSDESTIPALQEELEFLAGRTPNTGKSPKGGRSVMVMGHQDTDYQVIRKILNSSRQAGYTHIAFAANQKVQPEPEGLE